MILSTQSLKQITSPPIGVLFTFLLYLLILPISEVQAKTKAPIQKSTFQIAYEKAIQNKGTSFDFIDQKGNKRMYVIEKNGAINEIKSYKDSFSQKSTSEKRKVKKKSLSPQSSFELAWNNAIRKGLKTFQFTDQKRKIRTYVISKNGTVNEKVSLDDKFSSQKRVVKTPSLPRGFKSTDQKLLLNQELNQ